MICPACCMPSVPDATGGHRARNVSPAEVGAAQPVSMESNVRPSLPAIFGCFFVIGSQSFGGGTSAWIRREVVTKRGWLNDKQFLSCLAVCQIAPGPNPMNMAVFLGCMMRGTIGALTAFVALMAFPVVLCLVLGALYLANRHLPAFEILLGGLGAVAIGMNVANGIRLTRKNIRRPRQALMIVIVTLSIGICHFPLFYVLLFAVPAAIFIEARDLT
jgi:chromate transporter